MKETKKIYVVGNQLYYAKFITNSTLVEKIEDADIVLFTGGEDVDPSLYGCKKHSTTYSNIARDLYEKDIYNKIKPNQLAIGICRGSQFLCVMNGGKLIQNVTNHAIRDTHLITELKNSNDVYDITSTHHQMQYPFNLDPSNYTTLFIASYRYSNEYGGEGITFPEFEPEIVLYHKPNCPKCLAIQGHPEYMRSESPIVIKLNEIINSLVYEN